MYQFRAVCAHVAYVHMRTATGYNKCDRLQDGRIFVYKTPLCKTLAPNRGWGGGEVGVYSGVDSYSKYYGTCITTFVTCTKMYPLSPTCSYFAVA